VTRLVVSAKVENPFVVDNVNRVQCSCVSKKRGRWLINLVLVLGVLVFVGVSIIPLVGMVFEQKPPSTGATPVASQTSQPPVNQSELEAQAKGYELVLQKEPENQTALRGLLETRLKLRDVKGAIAPLEKLAKLNPQQSEYAVLLAQAKQKTGDSEGSAQTYRSILTSKPGDIYALQGLVGLLLEQNRPEAAIGLLQDTLKTATDVNQVQPGSVDVTSVQLELGKVYVGQNRFPEAIAIYDEAIKGNKQDFRPIVAKAYVLQQQGKTAEAKPLFDTAIALAPADVKDRIKQLATQTPTSTNSPANPPSNAPSSVPTIPPPQPNETRD